MYLLFTSKFNIERQNFENGCIKDQWQSLIQDQDDKPQSWTYRVLQSPKSGLKGHRCSLHLQNQDRETKFGTWVYQRPMTISKSRSRCQSPVRNWLKRHGCFLHLQIQARDPKFGKWVNKRPVTTSTSRSRWQTPVMNLQHPPKPKIMI